MCIRTNIGVFVRPSVTRRLFPLDERRADEFSMLTMDFPWDVIVSGINAAYNNARSDLRRGLLPEAPRRRFLDVVPWRQARARDTLIFLDNINRYSFYFRAIS